MNAIRVKPLGDWTDGKGVITVKSGSGEPRTIEREVEKQARKETDLTPEPLFDAPNRYADKKKCVHPDHQGDRWIHRSQFSHDARMSDGLHSYCRKCRARAEKMAYVPRWRRGVDKKRAKI